MSQAYAATAPPGRTTRAISATPLAGSGTKKITSGITATSNASSGYGRALASPSRNSAAPQPGPGARIGQLLQRRVDAMHRTRRAAPCDHLREDTVAASDIQPPVAGCRVEPPEEGVPRQLAPLSHVPLVRRPLRNRISCAFISFP